MKSAEKYYKLAIKANPENPDALGSYASYLHGVKGDVDAAEEKYVKAVEIDTTMLTTCVTTDSFCQRRKDYARAEATTRPYEVTPNHSNTMYNHAVMLDSNCERRLT